MPTNLSTNSQSGRTEILRRIRAATPATTGQSSAQIQAEWQQIQRNYRSAPHPDRAALLDHLEDRLRDYEAGVYRCAPTEVAVTAARILADRNKATMAIPAGLPQAWLPTASATLFMQDDRRSIGPIDACDGVLTSATLAIAETGTIVLQDTSGQGRRALSLLPDYHLCILEAYRVVASVPEAIALLQPTAALATTFFSGPSATADIEMTRIKGVHGPRFVDVILVL